MGRHPGLLVPDWTVVQWCTFAAAERQGHVPALEEFRSLHEEVRDEALFVAEVTRFGIGYHELVLDWLDGLPVDGS